MSERFTKLFTLPENLYTETSPVLIVAGALLKDGQTGKVLAQLKLKNISSKVIKALTVKLFPKDTTGQVLGDAIDFQYLDLHANRDDDFGSKTPIPFADKTTRSFDVVVSRVIFSDNSEWNETDTAWESLCLQQKDISLSLNDEELFKEYQLKFGEVCRYEVIQPKDLWVCSCGHVNRKEEAECHHCHTSLIAFTSLDWDALKQSKEERISKEKQAAKRRKKHNTIVAAILIPCVLVIAVLSWFSATKVDRALEKASGYANQGKFWEAVQVLIDLKMPKDEEDAYKVYKALNMYKSGLESGIDLAIQNGRYKDALALVRKYDSVLQTSDKTIVKIQKLCPHQKVELARVDSTCTTDGYVDWRCSECEFEDHEVLAAFGHAYVSEITTAPTCIGNGIETFTCETCQDVVKKDVAMLPHNFQNQVLKQATCTESGQTQQVCAACGGKQEVVTVQAFGHHYRYDSITEETCETDGLTVRVCDTCGDRHETVHYATGHKWMEANCTKPKTCTICKTTVGKSLGGHNWVFDKTKKEVNCTKCSNLFQPSVVYQNKGSFEYSKIVSIGFSKTLMITVTSATLNKFEVSQYSNKVILTINVRGTLDTKVDFMAFVDVLVYDSSGKLIGDSYFTTDYYTTTINESVDIYMEDVPSDGVFILKFGQFD